MEWKQPGPTVLIMMAKTKGYKKCTSAIECESQCCKKNYLYALTKMSNEEGKSMDALVCITEKIHGYHCMAMSIFRRTSV